MIPRRITLLLITGAAGAAYQTRTDTFWVEAKGATIKH